MVFLGLVMMPFYYISKTHSVPGYLQLRYGPKASGLSAISFGAMTILMSGVNMYAMAVVMKVVLGWNIHFSIWVSSLTVGAYVAAGGLFSAIFNEVLQFFLIWFGALLIPILGMIETGGWQGMVERIQHNFPGQDYTHMWSTLGNFQDNPMGMHWTGIVFGLAAVQSMGYWTTDFLVVQRVLSAKDIRSAKLAPILGSFFKMAVPFIVILPGLLGLALLPEHLVPGSQAGPGQHSFDEVLPLMMKHYFGPGLLGLGVTALVAGFMAGMAGNVSAFATVWTYDIYRPFIRKTAPDAHYVTMGRWCTMIGLVISIGTAYLVMGFASMMDYVQALFGFFIAPLFGTVLLGMMWKRATPMGGFLGLLAGTMTSVGMFLSMKFAPSTIAIFALSPHAKGLAQDMYQALWACVTCVVVTVLVSLATQPKPESELKGLVYSLTPRAKEEHVAWYGRPFFWGMVSLALFAFLQWRFW
jgi:SSS family solute:Na+ symporter